MAVTYVTRSTDGLLETSTDEAASPSQWGWFEQQLVTWLGELCDVQLDVSGIISGSGYQDGVYNDVVLVRSATTQTGGNNLKATVTITGGGVSNVEITQKGNGFLAGDYLIIPNLAEVGGTGSGFQIPVLSAAENIGLIHGPSNGSTDYPSGLQIGVERSDSFGFGHFWYRPSSTSTTYVYDVYRYDNTEIGNGYKSFNVQESRNISMWTDSVGGGKELRVWYCTEPGNEFFFFGDTNYANYAGIVKAVRPDDGTTWPSPDIVSPWTNVHTIPNSVYYRPLSSVVRTTAYTGNNLGTLWNPQDSGILFNTHTLLGRSWVQGYLPSRLYTHYAINKPNDFIYQDGADTYRRVNDVFYIKMN